MRRIFLTVMSLVCLLQSISAQEEVLLIQGAAPDVYLNHTILAKENYYSIARMYNVAPKEIASYNKLDFEAGLNLGQLIKIPLSQNNFLQNLNGGNKLLLPVYHLVEPKEGLYRISLNYNKVPLEQLKRWNNLSSDAVSNGTNLIVGYLKVGAESSLAKNSSNNPVMQMPKEETAIPKKMPELPKEAVANNSTTDVTKATDDTNGNPGTKTPTPGKSAINFNGGFFKNLYENQHISKTPFTESGLSGVFKSTSGWRDGKYYCFHNSAPPGTILRISNSLNNRSIYAKVLDLIPDITQNAGLILHISNAAAEDLGVSATKFDCSINYSK